MTKLPKLTKKPILYVDATPDAGYPLRILRAYRRDCDCMWAGNTGEEETEHPLLTMMNKDNHKRAEILDKAIRKLGGE